jgi:Tol biopolymer transport system component/DNA-binding winged helix-turn-helix (wHTH) protein
LSGPFYKFERFELDLKCYQLRRNSQVLKLEKIPMELLILLISRGGELVSREEIIEKLWGQDVFVETEHGINTAVRKIRQALGDDVNNSRFVQTVVGKGYRFIAKVSNGSPVPVVSTILEQENGRDETTDASVLKTIAQNEQKKLNFIHAVSNLEHVTSRTRWLVVIASLTIVLSTLSIWHHPRQGVSTSLPPIEVVPFAGLDGAETSPAFSPDGYQITFALHGERNSGIYSSLVRGGKPLQLTSHRGDGYPRWSPDGQQIAFARHFKDGIAIYVIPALGGVERRLYAGPATAFSHGFDWSPDGKYLAISLSDPDKTHAGIALLSLIDSEVRPLTAPSEHDLDIEPAFAPDGSAVAFVRSNVGGMVSELYVAPFGRHEVKRLTFDHKNICGSLAWTPDGREIVFSSTRAGTAILWRISASGGDPQPVQGASVDAANPSVSPKGNQLAYEQELFQSDVWQVDVAGNGLRRGAPVLVVGAKGLNIRPQFSPDGRKIALESSRSGYSEIWVCGSDGSDCGSLTSFGGTAGAPHWSPDSHYLAFEYRPNDSTQIYVMEVGGGQPRLLTTFSGADNGGPNWSRDGEWIYFYSSRENGRFQLWKVRPTGGSPIQVTKHGGIFGIESADGRFLYFAKFEAPGIWRMSLDGGEETRILDQPGGDVEWSNWALASNGIYFLDWGSGEHQASVQFFDFKSHQKINVVALDRKPSYGVAISPDQKSMLFSQERLSESHIVLVKNFH